MIPNAPDIDPANNGSLAGTLKFCMKKFAQAQDGMLPAKVISYDRTTNRAQVQLLIAMITTQNLQVSRPQIASIPVMVFGGGNFLLSFPLNTGDLGWVMANDRDISLFLQTYQESAPNTYRFNSFSDAVFIPDIMHGYTIASEDENAVVLQNIDGTIKISLLSDRIKLTAPLVEITGDLQIDGEITTPESIPLTIGVPVVATHGVTISGGGSNSLMVTGDTRVVGDITASGDITPHVP